MQREIERKYGKEEEEEDRGNNTEKKLKSKKERAGKLEKKTAVQEGGTQFDRASRGPFSGNVIDLGGR